uniref:Uncharacterized protein n=1 Tax=Geospiza parvula TaxID=87175 RepID=A0A8C3NP89_GEOPR
MQRELFPYYFHISSTCAFLNLTLFAMSHPSEQLGQEHKTQVTSPFLTHSPIPFLCSSGSLANHGDPRTAQRSPQLQRVEQSHGLGQELGLAASEPRRQLRASDPGYRRLARSFALHHALSSLCNLLCILCNGLSLQHLAGQLSAL